MVKTYERLTTARLTCPECKQKADIEFVREVTTLSLSRLRLVKIGKIVGRCTACGRSFEYQNKDKLYEYMDKTGESYHRSFFLNNLITVAIPVIMLIAIITVASMISEVAGPMIGQSPQGTAEPSPYTAVPFSVSGGNFNQTALMYNATLQLAAGSKPVDMEMLNVSVMVNGNITGTRIWKYGNGSYKWANASHQGTMMGQDDRMQVIVNLTKYATVNGDKVEMLYQIPDMPAATASFTMNKTAQPTAAKGNASMTLNNTSARNVSGKVAISGHVYINNNSAPGTTVTFTGENVSRSISADYSGYYRIILNANTPYTVTVKDSDLGTLMDTRSPDVFTSNSTLDIRLYT